MVHGLLTGHHAVDVGSVQHRQLSCQPKHSKLNSELSQQSLIANLIFLPCLDTFPRLAKRPQQLLAGTDLSANWSAAVTAVSQPCIRARRSVVSLSEIAWQWGREREEDVVPGMLPPPQQPPPPPLPDPWHSLPPPLSRKVAGSGTLSSCPRCTAHTSSVQPDNDW